MNLRDNAGRVLFVGACLVGVCAILGAGAFSWVVLRATRHPLTKGE